MTRTTILLFSLMLTNSAFGQVSLGYYPFQSEVSITSNSELRVWGDFRVATNTFFGNMTTEPILMINVKRKEVVNVYTGLGLNLNFFNDVYGYSILNGYTMHVGARVKPFKSMKNIQGIFELSPYVRPDFDGGLLRSRLGIAYQF
ncbi:MAG: hypothetical protein JJ975_17210 [Bacteroidia bacterium]|nr:hypothetical protein [Bacteroidia bacterium]